jgi:hypothetical protein
MLFAAGALAAPALAQQPTPPPADESQIVVEGRRDQGRQIQELLRSLPIVGPSGHIARFEESACPAAIGLSAEQKALIVRRMRTVAAAVGVPVGKPDCTPNVVIILTPDKRALLEQMERKLPDFLGELSHWEVGRLKASPNPTALWHMKEVVTADGRPAIGDSLDSPPINRTTQHASRLEEMAHPALTGSVLVIDTRALVGLTTTQIADYAVMRAFTGLDPARIPAGSPQSILKVIDTPMGSETPITLTRWDVAFIRSVYASNSNLYAPAQRGQITAAMLKDLERGDDPKPRK